MCRLLAEVDLVDPERRAGLEETRDLLDIFAALRDDRERVRERIRRERSYLLGVLLLHDPEGIGLRHEQDVFHERARGGDSRRLVHLGGRRLLGARVVRAVVDVHD